MSSKRQKFQLSVIKKNFFIYLTMIILDEPLASITSVGIGGKCNKIYMPESEEELVSLLSSLEADGEEFKVIGNGTNLLFSDNFHPFSVISTRKIAKKMSKRGNFVTFSASASLFECYNFTLKHSLSGFEKLAHIPGNIGGAIATGASCYGASIFDKLEKVTVYHNGKVKSLSKNNIEKGYHSSFFLQNDLKHPYVILSAKFLLDNCFQCKISQAYFDIASKRSLSQGQGKSYGCTFKNANGQSAGMLIDKCGLKGLKHGNAQISEKHGNFIINNGNATFEDFEFLIEKIQKSVKDNFNLDLVFDVEIVK